MTPAEHRDPASEPTTPLEHLETALYLFGYSPEAARQLTRAAFAGILLAAGDEDGFDWTYQPFDPLTRLEFDARELCDDEHQP